MRVSSIGAIKRKKSVEKVGGTDVLQSMECALAEIPIKMAQAPIKLKLTTENSWWLHMFQNKFWVATDISYKN